MNPGKEYLDNAEELNRQRASRKSDSSPRMSDNMRSVRNAIEEYHADLRARNHGGVAQSNCISRIENILDLHYIQ